MHEYRQALMRLRQGDSEREIARSGLMGRAKAARFRALAQAQSWLEPARPLPADAEIAAALAPPRLPVSAQSALAAYRPLVERWLGQGVSGVAIHAALVREHGFTGHYSSVRRLIGAIGRELPPDTTVRLAFDPGEAAQVDFGAGPALIDPATGPDEPEALAICPIREVSRPAQNARPSPEMTTARSAGIRHSISPVSIKAWNIATSSAFIFSARKRRTSATPSSPMRRRIRSPIICSVAMTFIP